jgi:hypothetical protein
MVHDLLVPNHRSHHPLTAAGGPRDRMPAVHLGPDASRSTGLALWRRHILITSSSVIFVYLLRENSGHARSSSTGLCHTRGYLRPLDDDADLLDGGHGVQARHGNLRLSPGLFPLQPHLRTVSAPVRVLPLHGLRRQLADRHRLDDPHRDGHQHDGGLRHQPLPIPGREAHAPLPARYPHLLTPAAVHLVISYLAWWIRSSGRHGISTHLSVRCPD